MSPKIFEYRGITLEFFSNDHNPIHVHAIYSGGYGMRVELYVNNGHVTKEYKRLKGKKEFSPAQMRDLKTLISNRQESIIQKWVDAKLMKKEVKRTVIRTKLK